MNSKMNIIAILLLATSCVFVSCNDWTDIETVDVKQPSIEEQNPELYAKYLDNLRQYKADAEHKKVYVWFDNSEKNPYSKGQHLAVLPDSIDVVSLMHPDHLADWELQEMTEIREKKGTKIVYGVDFDAMKSEYNKKKSLAVEAEPVTKDFQSFLLDSLQYALSLANTYNYNGICIGYNGKSILHMREDELREYKSNEALFIGIMTDWHKRNPDKSIDYMGKPQNLINRALLNDCNLILLSGQEATSKDMFIFYLGVALEEGIPSDRIAMVVSATSLDTSDMKTGYLADGTRAITGLADWAVSSHNGIEIAGIGIYNVSTDYYNPSFIYQYTREAIFTLNPFVK